MMNEPEMKELDESPATGFMSANGQQQTKITASTTLSSFWFDEQPSITDEIH